MFVRNKIASGLLLVGLIAALVALAHRHAVETANRTVEIALDYQEIEQIAGATGKTVGEVLDRFKAAGATSVAIQEVTVGDLIDNGVLTLLPGQMFSVGPPATMLMAGDPMIAARLWRHLSPAMDETGDPRRFGTYLKAGGRAIPVPASVAHLRLIPVGLDQMAVFTVRFHSRMGVVARLLNYPGANPRYLEEQMREMNDFGVKTIIFAQDQALGFRGLIKPMGRLIREHDLNYGSVEFAKQKGDAGLSLAVKDNLIRVHSITLPEMGIIDKQTAIERYARAVRERNIRLCYVRLFDFASADPIGVNVAYVKSIANAVTAGGAKLGVAQRLGDPAVPGFIFGLIAIGAAAGLALLLLSWFEIRPAAALPMLAVFCVFAFLLAFGAGPMGHKVVALGAAVVFPILALTWAVSERKPGSNAVARAALIYLGTITLTAAGGLLIAGLLSSRPFMLKVDQFAGVKLAHVVPILGAAFLVSAGTIWNRGTWREQKQRAAEGIASIARNPVLVWQAGITIVALGVIALMVARSGNDAGVGVSGFELKFRAILDRILFVRPRTKEFLVGHPALFLGLIALLAGKRNWAAPLLVIGTIGLISVTNTFCHAHTPIAISVARVCVGAIAGLVVGLVVLLISRIVQRRTGGHNAHQ